MKRLVSLSFVAATALFGAAYKIPEQSLNSTALGGAYVSHTTAADAAYFNPANMVFLPEGNLLEGNLMWIHLSPIDNESTGNASKSEDFLLPQFHYVSPKMGNWRIGFSFVEPGGLAKRWSDVPEKWSAKKFELKVIEANPSLAYQIGEHVAIAAGVRYIYTEGKIERDGIPAGIHPSYPQGTPDVVMDGDGDRFGYNLALTYREQNWGAAVTYRSKVDLKEEGSTKFYNTSLVPVGVAFDTEVTVPLPATLSLAAHYTFNDATTVELEYERVFWSDYEDLDFDYDNPTLEAIFGRPIPKDWDDTSTIRLGVTHRWDDKLTLMAAYAYDETPVPEKTLGYELPDSDAHIFSFGFRYRVNASFDVGMAYLYDYKEDRDVTNTNVGKTTFSGASAQLLSFGVGYRF